MDIDERTSIKLFHLLYVSFVFKLPWARTYASGLPQARKSHRPLATVWPFIVKLSRHSIWTMIISVLEPHISPWNVINICLRWMRYAILLLYKVGMGGSGFDAFFTRSTRKPNLLDHKYMTHISIQLALSKMYSLRCSITYSGSAGIWSTKLARPGERWKEYAKGRLST